MNAHDDDRMKQLLQQTLPPVQDGEPARDLWPAMQRRLEAHTAAMPWFDWVLAGALAIFVVVTPASIPVFLYYL